jgi:hypothetical protein
MRSSTFIIVSLIIHILIVAAVALSPSRRIEPDSGAEVEVSMGEPAETPGVEEAQEVTNTAPATAPAPAPAPVKEKPRLRRRPRRKLLRPRLSPPPLSKKLPLKNRKSRKRRSFKKKLPLRKS